MAVEVEDAVGGAELTGVNGTTTLVEHRLVITGMSRLAAAVMITARSGHNPHVAIDRETNIDLETSRLTDSTAATVDGPDLRMAETGDTKVRALGNENMIMKPTCHTLEDPLGTIPWSKSSPWMM
jgi:hypothetical protein